MVHLNRIYTKVGDTGETMLATGEMVSKTCTRVAAMGDVDELNATLGLAVSASKQWQSVPQWIDWIRSIQNDLFDLGADLAIPLSGGQTDESSGSEAMPVLRIVASQVAQLEHWIDQINLLLKPLTSFILPGGSMVASQLHLSRCVCRRAERVVWLLHEESMINEHAMHYLNRLSDLLFVLARAANDNGSEDVLWVPGANR